MKMPDEKAGASRKTLPMRTARKTKPLKASVMKRPAEQKNILKKGSDNELVKTFGEK
jgi:hypothetical protein